MAKPRAEKPASKPVDFAALRAEARAVLDGLGRVREQLAQVRERVTALAAADDNPKPKGGPPDGPPDVSETPAPRRSTGAAE